MALFSKKPTKTDTKTEKIEKKVKSPSKKVAVSQRSSTPQKIPLTGNSVLLPRITEKATWSAERGAYVFNISPRMTKSELKNLVEHFYKVRPVKVSLVKVPSKKTLRKGIPGKTASGKKAYVFLKKGDTITFA
ncbi:MAG: 50S ribosomal protein L23 [Patescibacteria group bacterium]